MFPCGCTAKQVSFAVIFSRYTTVGPFYSPREQSRLKLLPGCFAGSLSRMPRALMYRSAALLLIAPLLVVLDFFF